MFTSDVNGQFCKTDCLCNFYKIIHQKRPNLTNDQACRNLDNYFSFRNKNKPFVYTSLPVTLGNEQHN